jgi:hypothetical protein
MTFATDQKPQGQFGNEASPGRQLWAWELQLDQLLGLSEGCGRVQRANADAGEGGASNGRLSGRADPDAALRIAVILGVGAAGGVFGSLLAPRMGVVLGGLAATVAGRELGFRPSRTPSPRGRLQLDPSGAAVAWPLPSPVLCARCRSRLTRPPVLPDSGVVVPIVIVNGASVPWGRSSWTATSGGGPAPAKHALPAPGGARARTGRHLTNQARIRFRAAT